MIPLPLSEHHHFKTANANPFDLTFSDQNLRLKKKIESLQAIHRPNLKVSSRSGLKRKSTWTLILLPFYVKCVVTEDMRLERMIKGHNKSYRHDRKEFVDSPSS